MGPNSPWTTVLAHTIATEPFIIAGTSLEEPDLEYFLSGRQPHSVRRDRGPSFLIEPNPDAATVRDCERHGLTLYKGTLLDFFNELDANFPTRPLPIQATSGLSRSLFSTPPPSPKELALFSRDFSYVVAQQAQENADLGFFVGRRPTLTDIALGRDVSRASTLPLKSDIRRRIASRDWEANFLIIDDNAGSGKSTILTRAIFDLAAEGVHIFEYKCLSSPSMELCAKVFNSFNESFLIVCDDFADHVAAIVEIYRRINREDLLIIGFERSYRTNYILQTLAGNAFDQRTILPFSGSEAQNLILTMEKYGLASYRSAELVRQSTEIAKDPIAIAVCRIMNDFRPVKDIIKSLLRDSDENRLKRYLGCALASYCYAHGIAYSILSAAFESTDLQRQLRERDMLPLSFSDLDTKEYIVPTNPVLGQRVLRDVSESEPDLMFEVYSAIGANLAPYVNRRAIMKRTPEARVSQRLFDYDDVVAEFIPSRSEKFYLAMKRYWDWNSRYWEQFALLKLDQFVKSSQSSRFGLLSQAISHARHAIKLERHPLGLTTLGRILLEEAKQSPQRFEASFKEAFEYLDEAIRLEGKMNRIAIHPYMTLFSGANNHLKQLGVLSSKQIEKLRLHMDNAEKHFSYDSGLLILIRELRDRLRD
jgi:hypothetical protein